MFEQPYEDILQEMLDDVPNHLDKREGSIIFTALAPAAKKVYDLQIQMDRVLELTFASTSEDEFLELRTKEMGISRNPAIAAIREGIFDIPVPKGSRFFVDDLYFVTQEEGREVPMLCDMSGEVGNIPVAGTSMLPVDNVPGLETATIGRIITPGSEEEPDEELYQRYVNRVSRPTTSGNIYHYMQWASEVPGVRIAKIFPTWDGPLTVKVVVVASNGMAPSPELIDQVYEHIEEERPIGADVTVAPAIERAIDVVADVQVQGNATIEEVKQGFIDNLKQLFLTTAFVTDTVRYARIATLILEQSGALDWQNLTINGVTSNIELGAEEIAILGDVTFNEF